MQTTKDEPEGRQAAFERDMQAVSVPARRSSGGQKGARRRNRWSEEEAKLLGSLVGKASCAAASCCQYFALSGLLWLVAPSDLRPAAGPTAPSQAPACAVCESSGLHLCPVQIGRGKWAQILEAGKHTFQGRSQVDLKVSGLSCGRANRHRQ